MEILGIGPFELILILVISLIVLGPDEMVKAGATVGKFIRKVRLSETWQGFQRMSRSLRTLPEDLARQTGLEEMRKDITKGANFNDFEASQKGDNVEQDLKAWTQTPEDFEHAIGFESSKGKEKKSTSPEIDQEA
jgi:Sec-independent protein translocase protein TatA